MDKMREKGRRKERERPVRDNNQRNREINKRGNLRDKNNKKKGMRLTVVSDLSPGSSSIE